MKKEFEKAEIEVIRFEEQDDIVTQSTGDAGGGSGTVSGGGSDFGDE